MNLRIGTMPESTAGGSAAEAEVMTQHPRAQGRRAPEREGEGQGMALARFAGGVVTSALLAAAVLGAVLGAPRAQAGATGQARFMESPSEAMAAAQRRRAREALRLQRLRLDRAAAHARMPDTMYASTPDGAPPPHPIPLDVKRPGAPAPLASPVPAPPPPAHPGHRIPLFVSASGASGSQGVARIINRSDASGEVRIEGYDDAGVRHGPVRLRLGAGEAVHLSAAALERGHGAKGLVGRLGVGEGDWRLEVASGLDLEVLGYLRTRDGFLTAMHDVVPEGESGHRVVLFNAGSNVVQASRLRIVNPGTEAAAVRIEGIDDAGVSSHRAVTLTLGAGAARTLTARALESGGAGLAGALGTGTGRWRLHVTADRPVEVMSLIASASGHLVNVSTAPAAVGGGESGAGTVHRVAWLPAAARWRQGGVRGLLRLVNHTRAAGEVRIEAFDDAGVQAPAVAVAVGAHEAVELTSAELEGGNAAKGLSGGIGAGEGDWWLRLNTGLEVEVLAYVQAHDGMVSSVHDVVPRVGGVHRVRVFNPASETSQTSRLRLVNPGAQAARVRIEGIDDAGVSSPGAVTLTLGAGAARTLGAAQLESGEGVSGGLGDGAGRWRLEVSADAPIAVMSPLAGPGGHLANLSTAPGAATETAQDVFAARISKPVVQEKCVLCHTAGGVAGVTRLHFERASNPAHEALNLKAFEDFVAEVDDGADYILNKIQGVGHGGGVQVAAGTAEFTAMERFLGLLGKDVTTVAITPQTLFDTVTMAPTRKTLRRAALIFAGRNPTDAEYAAAQRGAAALRRTIRGLMTGPQFHEFLIRGANDRLLTDRDDGDVISRFARHFVDYTNEAYRRLKAARERGNEREFWEWKEKVQHGARRAPVELIAHVVENDRPYTEILTADYVMANPWSANAYGASTRFDDPGDVHEFKPSQIVSYYRKGDGFEEEYDPVLGPRIVDSGPLGTDWPHAGVLNTMSFLRRYPTTATNRNRARSRWAYYHFLGLDIEKSASRTTDPIALADTNNPTKHNPACTVCHRVLDPVAGAFQNYGDEGYYKDQWGGVDSLDRFYKKDSGGPSHAIRAESWSERETLSWPVWMAAGVETLRVLFTNPVSTRDTDTGKGGEVYLDRLRVTDARGQVLASREFEDLGPPVHPGSERYGHSCGRMGRNPSGSEDHVKLWWGDVACAIFVDVEVPSDGVYSVEVVAWSNGYIEQYGEDGFARLAVGTGAYQVGDTWYRDMRTPGFADAPAPNPDNSVQWLARKIVADERFAEATVKFWWPAVMGSEVAEPPEEEEDADFEGLLLAANAQGAEVERLARGFRGGFSSRRRHNLKDLLVELVLSKWFRADTVEDTDAVRRVALRDAGARRLLTPEELDRKTAAVTGYQWGRGRRGSQAYRGALSRLTEDYRLLYGGIDSDGVAERARDITSVMAGVTKRHAVQVSCPVVMRDFYLVPDAERRLFAGIDRYVTPGSELGALFEIEARSRAGKETLSLSGALTAGPKTVRLAFTNDYWGGSNAIDRNVHLDRLDVRSSAGRVVASRELEELPSPEDCRSSNGDNFALWCEASVEVPVEIPAAGSYSIEIVAWADQAGDELARLSVVVESDAGGAAGENAIRSKLVELYDKLLGVQVTPHSPDVEAAYRLFVDVMDGGRRMGLGRGRDGQWFKWWHCDSALDLSYFEGILDDVVVEREGDDGWRWYEFDWDRVNEFMNGINWSDPHHTAQAWVVVLASLLMDYRYLYL